MQSIGEVARSDGGVNPYSKKTYEIFSTPLLRNSRFFGVSPILLSQHRGEVHNAILNPYTETEMTLPILLPLPCPVALRGVPLAIWVEKEIQLSHLLK